MPAMGLAWFSRLGAPALIPPDDLAGCVTSLVRPTMLFGRSAAHPKKLNSGMTNSPFFSAMTALA